MRICDVIVSHMDLGARSGHSNVTEIKALFLTMPFTYLLFRFFQSFSLFWSFHLGAFVSAFRFVVLGFYNSSCRHGAPNYAGAYFKGIALQMPRYLLFLSLSLRKKLTNKMPELFVQLPSCFAT